MSNVQDTPGEMMDVEQVAAYLGLHPLTVRRLARDGEIPAFKVGRQWRVKRGLLGQWIEERSFENMQHPPNEENA